MTQIVPFENAQLPAYLTGATSSMSLNSAAEEFASVKFPVISIKNSRFHIVKDGERSTILRPKSNATDPDEPASYIDMVVLNLQKAKTFYVDGYTEGSTEKPDCYSNDGIRPDTSAENKQCAECALCPHNAWGSGKNDKGEATRGKACSDVLRLAVASPADFDNSMLLRVPPASLKNFAEASKVLSRKNIPLNAALMRISFDSDANGVLMFKPVGLLDQSAFTSAQQHMTADIVLAITGKNNVGLPTVTTQSAPQIAVSQTANPVAQEAAQADAAEQQAAAEAAKKKADAKAKKVAAAKAAAEAAAAAAAAAEDDDEEEEAAPVAATPVKTQTKVASSDNFDAELNALIG